jgi:hypothetical protein
MKLDTIAGTIHAVWTRPIVNPAGTEYQIIRSTNSANAAVGTVVWQGNALQVALVMPTSTHAYWVRAVTGSAASPYTPNTFGLLAAARDESESARNKGAFKDWNFELSPYFGSYWNTNLTSVFSLSPTGGVDGGRLIVVPRSAQLYAVPVRPYELVKARLARTSMRIRCTSLGIGTNTGNGCVWSVFGWDGVSTPTQTNSNYLGGASAALALGATLTANVGKWFEFTSVGTLLTDQFGGFNDVSSWPYICGVLNTGNMGTTANSASGLFEIDFLSFDYL